MHILPSQKSIQWFVLINGTICSIATIQYFYPILVWVKVIVLLYFLEIFSKGKPFIHDGPRTLNPAPWLIQATLFEVGGHAILERIVHPTSDIRSELIWFIPTSFLFEIVFDFFHYWTHRLCHMHKGLYRRIHSVHHSVQLLQSSAAFKHHALDLMITNVFPLFVTVKLLPVNMYSLTLIMWYKTLQEIAGHSGKDTRGSSFSQFKWVPQWLGIALYSRNHTEHHRNPSVNFAKRFSLWDRVFGTFQE